MTQPEQTEQEQSAPQQTPPVVEGTDVTADPDALDTAGPSGEHPATTDPEELTDGGALGGTGGAGGAG